MVSNTVDAHYNLTRFFIEGIRLAGSDDKEAMTEAMVGQSLLSGNGEVHLRPVDRHVDLNVLIAEATRRPAGAEAGRRRARGALPVRRRRPAAGAAAALRSIPAG